MAATSKKKTSSGKTGTTKKKGGARAATSRTSPARSGGGRSTGGKKQSQAPRPIRREIGAVVCLLLAFFAALSCFQIEGLFLEFFAMAGKGLLGYGYWLLPLILLWCSYILAFHRGRPVRLRLWSTGLIPVLLGALLHLVLAGGSYAWSLGLFKTLWSEGQSMKSGGVLAGVLAQGLISVFSKIGAGIVLVLALAVAVLLACRVNPADVVDYFRDRPRAEYDEADYPDEPTPAASLMQRSAARSAARRDIHIPIDDEEEEARQPDKPARKGFFDRKPRVPTPDQILAGHTAQTEAVPSQPVWSDEEIIPVEPGDLFPVEPEEPVQPETVWMEREQPKLLAEPTVTMPEPLSMSKQEILERAAQPDIPLDTPAFTAPEIIRDPVMPKVQKEEAQQAAQEVSQEVEQNLAQPVPVYQHPPLELLDAGSATDAAGVTGELRANQARLTDTIHSFGIEANIVSVTRGPSVTRYELELDQGVRLNKLTNLSDDIALALGASGVRIAPIPDKISMVGIEVPNKLVAPVAIRDVIGSEAFRTAKSNVSFAVGKDISNQPIICNIAKMPHLLIAGTTGSGKSVCTNSLIISLLYKSSPEEVRLIMVDPKMVELGIYNGIPHLLIPVVTDPKKAAGALQWAVVEMMKRYRTFSEVGVRDLAAYNALAAQREELNTMPQIVVVIDELADLMLVAAKEVEESICRVAQMGRASGIHLIIATQRPSADVITGLMKANIPSRIAFAVASGTDSRIILDQVGAEKLVGRGDMLYAPLGGGKPTRVQGCLITDEEVARVVEFVKQSGTAQYDEAVLHEIEKSVSEKDKGSGGGGTPTAEVDDSYDELLPSAIEVVVETGMASVSMLQRRLKLGYSRAARLVDQMEEKGIVGPFEGSKPRQVLITKAQWQELQYKQGMVEVAPNAIPVSEPVPDELEFEGDAIPQSRDLPPFDLDSADF